MKKRAHELSEGDLFALHIHCRVIAVAPIGDGKQVKVTVELEDQGHRTLGPTGYSAGPSSLEFTDDRHTLEFICRASRWFHTLEDWDDDDDDDDDDDPDPVDPPPPRTREPA